VALRKTGLSTRAVANVIGCAPASVTRWEQDFDKDGPAGLDPKPQGGSRPKLSDKQREELKQTLIKGARAAGFPTELWTLSRVKKVVEKEFDVTYHIGHLWRVLRELGFSAQKPAKRAREQDETAVETFRAKAWPAVKKKRAKSTEPLS